MKRVYLSAGAFSLSVWLGACANTPPPAPAVAQKGSSPPAATHAVTRPETPDAPFRANPPAPGPEVPFTPPDVKRFTLKNGVTVMLVERAMPYLSMRVVVRAGAGDLKARPGAVDFLGAMLLQGTEKKNALELSDAFNAIGASYGADFNYDSGDVSVRILSDQVRPALELLTEVVLHPTFPTEELERMRSRKLTALAEQKNSPRQIALNAVNASLYGRAHPYGNALTGREADIKAITRADLQKLYKQAFAPSLTTIVVAGDITEAAIKNALEPRFGTWSAPARKPAEVPPVKFVEPKANERLVFVDMPGAPQSQIYLTTVGMPKNSPDREAIDIANAIFGGMFSSRVNLNLREKHAYTYGARSAFTRRRGPSPFFVGAAVVREKTAPAISEIFAELDAIRSAPVTEEELALAKESVLQWMNARFETVNDLTSALGDLAIYGLPVDDYKTRPDRIRKVTAEDVKRVAQTWLDPKKMKVVVVGDRATIGADLESLHLGAPQMLDAFGDPITAQSTQVK